MTSHVLHLALVYPIEPPEPETTTDDRRPTSCSTNLLVPVAGRHATRRTADSQEESRGGTMCGMTFANVGTLGVRVGGRDELVSILTRRNDALRGVGCLAYEVGVNEEEPDTVFVVELWEDRAAHQASLSLPEVQAAIAAARPLLSGEFGGSHFTVVGSPLRD